MTGARYKRFDRIPKGFTRQTKLKDVKPGDELLWTDDGEVSVVSRIELAGPPGQKGRGYRVETADGRAEELGSASKLFIRPV